MYKKVLIACAGLVLLISGVALAGVPCAGTTTVSATGNGDCAPDAAVAPDGDQTNPVKVFDDVIVTVTVKDCYGTPLAGQMVTVNAASAGGNFYYCPDGDSLGGAEDTKLVGPTDALGVITATFRKFGGFGNIEFYATIGTVIAGPSASIFIASVDNNTTPDGKCDLVDFGNFAQDFQPNYNQRSDYDCDSDVDLVDFGNFAVHFNQGCASTP
jgi:hypothetical protein